MFVCAGSSFVKLVRFVRSCSEKQNKHLLLKCLLSFRNSGSREKFFENVFFEPVWRRKLFQMKVWVAAINSIKFSSKSELTSRFFSRLKFRFFFETSNGRLPLEISSDRPQTWPKRVSDDPRRFIFRRPKKISAKFSDRNFSFSLFGQKSWKFLASIPTMISTMGWGCAASRCWFQQWAGVALHPDVDFNNGLGLRCIPLLVFSGTSTTTPER